MSAREQKKLQTRERIGLGTLFNYAQDKRDLVFLIFNEELNAITDVALAAPRPGDRLLDQLLAVFRVHFRRLGSKPALARILLDDGIEALVREAQAAGLLCVLAVASLVDRRAEGRPRQGYRRTAAVAQTAVRGAEAN